MSLSDIGAAALRLIDPETAHGLAIRALKTLPLPAPGADDPVLRTTAGRPEPVQSGRSGGWPGQEWRGLARPVASGFRLRGMRLGHAAGPARQPQAAPVPPDRGPGHHQPDGLQQCRAGGLRRASDDPAGRRRRRGQSGGQQGYRGQGGGLCRRPETAQGPGRLFHRQCLLTQYAGPARAAGPRRAGRSAGPVWPRRGTATARRSS